MNQPLILAADQELFPDMNAYTATDYTLGDIERFVALSIRRGSTLASLEKNDATKGDLRAVAGAALLYWPQGEAARAEALAANARFMTEAGDWLRTTPEELLDLQLALGWGERRDSGFASRLYALPGVTRARLVDELESARAILAARRAEMRVRLQEKNRTVNDGAPEIDAQEDGRLMREALLEAERAAEAGEIPVGAVLVREGEILARAGNRTIRDKDPTAHAEVLVLREGARLLGNHRLTDTTLYVTLEPCPMCAGAIAEARPMRLVFGAADPRKGAVGGAFGLFDIPGVNHRPWVTRGVLEEPSARLLKTFFAQKRSSER